MPDYAKIIEADFGGEGNPLHPYDPVCKRYATDIDDYDEAMFDSQEDYDANGPATPEMREKYVISGEGTYNPLNGHFTCVVCYINIGMPSGPGGWKCP